MSETEFFYPTEFFTKRYRGEQAASYDLPEGSVCHICGRGDVTKGLVNDEVLGKSFTDQRRAAPKSGVICHFCATTLSNQVKNGRNWFVPFTGEATIPPKGTPQWWVDILLNPPDEPFLLCRTLGMANAKHMLYSSVVSAGGPFYHVTLGDRPFAVDAVELKEILRLIVDTVRVFGERVEEKKSGPGFCLAVTDAILKDEWTYVKKANRDVLKEMTSKYMVPLLHQDTLPVIEVLIRDMAKIGIRDIKI